MLVLGGGDGLAVREVLKCRSVERASPSSSWTRHDGPVPRQPQTRRAQRLPLPAPSCTSSMPTPFGWLEQSAEHFDVIVIDFPDPSNFALGKLYSGQLLCPGGPAPRGRRLCRHPDHLAPLCRRSFWTVVTTVESVGSRPRPTTRTCRALANGASRWPRAGLHTAPPTARGPALPERPEPAGAVRLPPDMARVPTEVNRLSNQVLVQEFRGRMGSGPLTTPCGCRPLRALPVARR